MKLLVFRGKPPATAEAVDKVARAVPIFSFFIGDRDLTRSCLLSIQASTSPGIVLDVASVILYLTASKVLRSSNSTHQSFFALADRDPPLLARA